MFSIPVDISFNCISSPETQMKMNSEMVQSQYDAQRVNNFIFYENFEAINFQLDLKNDAYSTKTHSVNSENENLTKITDLVNEDWKASSQRYKQAAIHNLLKLVSAKTMIPLNYSPGNVIYKF